jgi:hypothetical protein
MAELFWRQLAAHADASAEFRAIAQSMLLELQNKKQLIDRMA